MHKMAQGISICRLNLPLPEPRRKWLEDGEWSFTGSPSEQQQQGTIEATAAAKINQQRQQQESAEQSKEGNSCPRKEEREDDAVHARKELMVLDHKEKR